MNRPLPILEHSVFDLLFVRKRRFEINVGEILHLIISGILAWRFDQKLQQSVWEFKSITLRLADQGPVHFYGSLTYVLLSILQKFMDGWSTMVYWTHHRKYLINLG